tara:strand:- start:112 stop:558 length:447 start_codon:yes stop_codon:yes gene_type:complete
MKLKNLLFFPVFFSLILLAPAVNAEKVVDVMTYANNNDLNDLYSQANLMQRCAGFYMGYAKYLPTDMKKQKVIFSKVAENIIVGAGMKLYEKNQNDNEGNMRQNMEVFLFYTNHYYSLIEKSQLATGSIFSGQVFKELNFCKALLLKK